MRSPSPAPGSGTSQRHKKRSAEFVLFEARFPHHLGYYIFLEPQSYHRASLPCNCSLLGTNTISWTSIDAYFFTKRSLLFIRTLPLWFAVPIGCMFCDTFSTFSSSVGPRSQRRLYSVLTWSGSPGNMWPAASITLNIRDTHLAEWFFPGTWPSMISLSTWL